MAESKILEKLAQKETDKEKIAAQVIKKPDLLEVILEGLNAKPARVKYPCAKVIRIISDQNPEMLYPHFDIFVNLLDHENNVLKWEGIYVLANLARVDDQKKFEKIFDKYFAPICGPVLITAANVIGGAAKIARVQPRLTEKIAQEILKVEKAKYKTAECRRVALGQTINTFDEIFVKIKNKEPVIKLVKKQLKNPRPSTRKKAENFLKKHRLIPSE
ncbi:MAG: hypothetical protein AMJ79_07395 [Phycisphaerae bacterium SM23_30]|nr:MAG: hypothetical protein AMJ79_07395 [Phycisphaerae bacterium SM23_30]